MVKSTKRYLCLLILCIGSLQAEEFRTWHTITGGHFEAKLVSVQSPRLTLANREGKTIEFPLLDLKPSDREYAAEWQMARAGEESVSPGAEGAERSDFAQRVYRDLVYSKGGRLARFKPEPSDAPKYFAFYRSAAWCPPCRSFTPKLVEFYKKQKRGGASFELVFISSDQNEDAMAGYMEDYNMPWPAFKFGENKDIVSRKGNGIPNLIVTDANGKRLLGSYDDSGKFIGPGRVMHEFEKLLGK